MEEAVYNAVFPAAFALAHRSLIAALIFALTAALNFFRLRGFSTTTGPLILAHRALAAAAILARPATDIRRLFLGEDALAVPRDPSLAKDASSVSSSSMCSLIVIALRS
jgi:hypothetical protein